MNLTTFENLPNLPNNERGVAMIELMLMLPIVLMFAFVSLEISRYLKTDMELSFVAKEISKHVFRDCEGRLKDYQNSGDDEERDLLDTCLENVASDYKTYWVKDVFPDTKILISVYSSHPNLLSGTTPAEVVMRIVERRGRGIQTFQSRFTDELVIEQYLDLVQSTESIFIIEVYVPNRPYLPGFAALANLVGGPIYAASIV